MGGHSLLRRDRQPNHVPAVAALIQHRRRYSPKNATSFRRSRSAVATIPGLPAPDRRTARRCIARPSLRDPSRRIRSSHRKLTTHVPSPRANPRGEETTSWHGSGPDFLALNRRVIRFDSSSDHGSTRNAQVRNVRPFPPRRARSLDSRPLRGTGRALPGSHRDPCRRRIVYLSATRSDVRTSRAPS